MKKLLTNAGNDVRWRYGSVNSLYQVPKHIFESSFFNTINFSRDWFFKLA